MQSFARMPANLFNNTGSDDIVVVGRISLNTKKAKKNLTKIANNNSRTVSENCGYEAPKTQTKKALPYHQKEQKVQVQVHQVQEKAQRTRRPRQNNKTHTNVVAVVKGSSSPNEQPVAVQMLVGLPDAMIAQIMMFTDLSSVGRMAQTCQGIGSVLGAESNMWCSLGAMQGLVLRAAVPRDAFRQAIFGLEGNWLSVFTEFAADGDAQEVLHEADYLCGGMVASNRMQAHALVQIVTAAATRCAVDLDGGAAMVLSTLRKIEARPEVFTEKSQSLVREAHLDLRERAVLERLATDDAPTFDYFQDAEDEVVELDALWEDAEEAPKVMELSEDESRDLAASFLEVMGLRHGHNQADVEGALRGLEA